MREPSNKKADIGSAVHKVLEGIALVNVAKRDGKDYINDPECFGKIPLHECTLNNFTAKAFEHYKESSPHHKWTMYDKEEIKQLCQKVLDSWGGVYHPIKREIFATEFHFDIEVEEDWGKYEYEIQGQKYEGRLRIKGTVDQIARVEDECGEYYEVLDFKTGASCKDWATGKEKDLEAFSRDHQLRLYHYALSKAMPGKKLIFTILFIRLGWPFTLAFQDEEVPKIENELKQHFQDILNMTVPTLRNDFFCDRVCHFGKTIQPGTDKTICKHMHDEIVEMGIQRVVDKYIDVKSVVSYSGGGKTLTEDGDRVTKH